MGKNILLIGGSLNQTQMMHQIAMHLPGENCYFTPFYADRVLGFLSARGLLGFSILGGRHRQNTLSYLNANHLAIDPGGKSRDYDAVITCSDLIVQQNVLGKRLVLVQEGMTEPEGVRYGLVRALGLPRFLANTAATGLSHAYDVFCVASPGYRDLFVRKGVRPEKIAVTGIPNFDNLEAYRKNDFPHRHYVLAATSSTRETLGFENRVEFIKKARRIADGKKLIFKLHPIENVARARREIETYAPEALIYTDGNIHHMVANCDVLVTQYSSVVYLGLALKKEVHAALDIHMLRKLTPIQNGGKSAVQIAHVCQKLLEIPLQRLRKPHKRPFSWEKILRGNQAASH